MLKSILSIASLSLFAVALPAHELPNLPIDGKKDNFGGLREQIVYRSGIDYQADGEVLKITNKTPNRYCSLHFKVDFAYDPNIVLSFEYRNIPGDSKVAYTAVNLFATDGESCVKVFPFSTEWKTASVRLGELTRISDKQPFAAGTAFKEFAIYSRIDNRDEPGVPSLEIRNIKFTEQK